LLALGKKLLADATTKHGDHARPDLPIGSLTAFQNYRQLRYGGDVEGIGTITIGSERGTWSASAGSSAAAPPARRRGYRLSS
jgi:hypothetical protein